MTVYFLPRGKAETVDGMSPDKGIPPKMRICGGEIFADAACVTHAAADGACA